MIGYKGSAWVKLGQGRGILTRRTCSEFEDLAQRQQTGRERERPPSDFVSSAGLQSYPGDRDIEKQGSYREKDCSGRFLFLRVSQVPPPKTYLAVT